MEVSPDGQIEQFINLAERFRSISYQLPSSFMTVSSRWGELSSFPIVPGASEVVDITRKARVRGSISGFTTIVGLAYRHDELYALELSTTPGDEALGAGKVVHLDRSTGAVEAVRHRQSGLPGGTVFGPDDALYVSNFGSALPGGAPQPNGEIVRYPASLFEHESCKAIRDWKLSLGGGRVQPPAASTAAATQRTGAVPLFPIAA